MKRRTWIFSLCLFLSPLYAGEKDIPTLKERLKTDPENGSVFFQLAESHQAIRQYSNAIYWYKRCVKKGEHPDLIWNSSYNLGQCYEAIDDWSEALYWYLEAHQANPNRSEPLLKITTYYRFRGENHLAYIFAKYGAQCSPCHDYHFDHELSIVSFYTHFKEDGYAAASDLLIRKEIPWDIKYQTYQNLLFYCQTLKNATFQPIAIDLPRINAATEERYHPMNPSIRKTEEGYELICRSVNYTQRGAKEFETVDPDGYIRTRNFLLEFSKDFQLLSQEEIIEDLPRSRLPSCNVLGLEDARLFAFQNASWFTCTTRDNTLEGIPQISLCKIGADCHVERMVLLQGPDPYRCEKNWLPFIQDGELYVIYSYDPFIIYKPDVITGDCSLSVRYLPAHDFTQFRGSAGPIAFDGGYLLLIHEVIFLHDYSRVYTHRFLQLDHRFFPNKISKPFVFMHSGVEFCGGITLNHEEDKLILSIGIEDNQAYLGFLDLNILRSLLSPLQ